MGGTGGCKVKLVARPGPLAGNRQADPLQKPRVVPRRLSHRLRGNPQVVRCDMLNDIVRCRHHRTAHATPAVLLISAHMSTRPRCGGEGEEEWGNKRISMSR